MNTYRHIRVEAPEAGIQVVSFIRPAKLNAISRGTLEDLLAFVKSLAADRETKVVVIRGDGDRAFCSGADFDDLYPNPEDRMNVNKAYQLQEDLREIVVGLRNAPQVIISACHGYAVGGGMFIALASDIRIIAEDVKFSAPLLKMGMSCGDMGSAYLLPRLIGAGAARDFLLSARYMYAEEAMRLGLASQCVPLEQLDQAAMEKARTIAAYDYRALQYSKELLNIMEGVSNFDDAIKIENRNQQLVKLYKHQK